MYLKEIAKIIYEEGTASENTNITIKTFDGDHRILWNGKAKDLQNFENINGWIVVEILVNHEENIGDTSFANTIPDYNKGKIITVI